jgi:hypothetical protein
MVNEVTRRPAIAVGAWCVLVLAVFVWRGDLGLGGTMSAGESTREQVAAPTPEVSTPTSSASTSVAATPVVVRRDGARAERRVATAQRRGRVFDTSGFLVVGAEVVPETGPAIRTDAEGAFEVDVGAASCLDLLVRAEGRRPTWVRASAGSPDPLVVQLAPAAPWDSPVESLPPLPALRGEGTVRGPEGPLAGAFVHVVDSAIWACSDDVGRFVLPLPAQSVSLLVHRHDADGRGGGFAAAPVVVHASRGNGVVPLPELRAEPAVALQGIVRDARGMPADGAVVEVSGPGFVRRLEAGAGGYFRLAGLVAGEYTVRPLAYRGAIGRSVPVVVASTVVDCELRLEAAAERAIRVVDEAGAPLPGVYVASTIHGQRRGVAQSDREGLVSVPVADATDFEARSASLAPLGVRRFEPEPPTLVVSMP